MMLDLDSPKWSELTHAYGCASDIPGLLKQFERLPTAENGQEPWFSLWSALAHQGEVYPASFAAVPHIVNFLSYAPATADAVYFQFPAWVEISRQKHSVPIPQELATAYFAALKKLPALVAAAADRQWDAGLLGCALSAVAASQGFGAVAEAVLEMTPDIAGDFMAWFYDR
ncbi:hypothetical protein [Methylovulum psychrotolerans]|nr:hypothetical protein [Methylovulum psychrotolerans]